jgi:hypothetical protein
MAQPVFGIGPKGLSICEGRCITVTEHFREAGLTQINGYSLYLDSLGQKSTGRVLFGAIDNNKYEGSLREIPLVNSSALMTNVTHLTVGSKIVAAGVNMTVLLDTGSTLCYFPASLSQRIADVFNATYNSDTGLFFVDQYPASSDMTLNFTFSRGASISVPLTEMLIDAGIIVGGDIPAPYVLGFMVTLSNKYILGTTFLRSAYLAVDLTHMRAAIGQASYLPGHNITVIGENGLSFM